jgi:DNA polymerase type B, organellar and viral
MDMTSEELEFEFFSSDEAERITRRIATESQNKVRLQQERNRQRVAQHRQRNLTAQRQREAAIKRTRRATDIEYVRKDNDRRSSTWMRNRVIKPFAGVDGEGATIDGVHRYVLLRAGSETIVNDAGLGWEEMLSFFCNLPPGYEYVSFFFDYDVTMILRSFGHWLTIAGKKDDAGQRNGGLVKNGVATLGGKMGMWRVWYTPRSEFAVLPIKQNPKNRKLFMADPARGHYIRISDTSKFFHSKFVKVIKDWDAGTPEIRELIGQGKDRRAEEEHYSREMDDYNRMECESLAEVMGKLRDECHRSALYPARWQGPGWLAASMFSRNHVPRRKYFEPLLPEPVIEAARAAYFGGHMEAMMFGPVPGPYTPVNPVPGKRPTPYRNTKTTLVTEPDINGAYPYAMTFLPCILHSKWVRTRNRPGPLALVKVISRYKDQFGDYYHRHYHRHMCNNVPWVFTLPHRDRKGRVSFPPETAGWYWSFEIDQAIHNEIQILDSWTWEPANCNCNTFQFMFELYETRKQMEREYKNRGLPLKLAMNSAYGKLAQTIGAAPYHSYILAGFITAHCRARIMEMVHEQGCQKKLKACGSNVVMIATDAIWFLGDPGYQESDALGGLKIKRHENGLFVVQSGIYYSEHIPEPKTRGMPVNLILKHEPDFRNAYAELAADASKPGTGQVKIPWRKFLGIREAVHRNSQAGMGTFYDETRTVGFNWEVKRIPHARHDQPWNPSEPLWTLPRPAEDIVSKPYDRMVEPWIGGGGIAPEDLGDNVMDMLNDSPEHLPSFDSPAED